MTAWEALALNCAVGVLIGLCALPWRRRIHDGTLLEWFVVFGVFWQLAIIGAIGLWAAGGLRKHE